MNNARSQYPQISAILLAAGLSKRMKQPKPLLRWGDQTVIRHIVEVLLAAGVGNVIVVCGQNIDSIQHELVGTRARTVYNPNFENGEMVDSVKAGLAAISNESLAALICLADQPMMQTGTIEAVIGDYFRTNASLVFPSYQHRRGHPWLVDRNLWPEIINLQPPQTLRDFLARHASDIQYVQMESETILADMDTPEQYTYWHEWYLRTNTK